MGDCSKDEEEKDSSLDTQQNQTQEASRNGSDSQQDLLSNGRDDENENSSLNEDPSGNAFFFFLKCWMNGLGHLST